MRENGAELVPIDTIKDQTLPGVDGLFLGGGFPETAMEELEANSSLRQEILNFIENQVRFGCRGLTSTTAVMSGGWTDDQLNRARKLGCRTFHKPFDLDEFILWIRTCEEQFSPHGGSLPWASNDHQG